MVLAVNKYRLVYFTLSFVLLLILVADELDLSLRYIKYILPAIVLIALAKIGKVKKPDARLLSLFWIYLIIILINAPALIVYESKAGQFFKEMVFILSPLLLVIFLSTLERPSQRLISWILFLPVIAYALTYTEEILAFLQNAPSLTKLFINSSAQTESPFSFALGISFLYFLTRRKFIYAAIIFFFVLLSFKRIVIGGCLLSGIIFFFIPESFINKRIRSFRLIQFLGFVLFFVTFALLFEGVFDDYLRTNSISLNALTQGRYDGYKIVLEHFGLFRFFGSGLGSTYSFLESIIYPMLNLHSDHLKYLIEFGTPLYIVWLLMFIRLGTFDKNSLITSVFFGIVLLTDNISIYFIPLFYYYFVQSLNASE